jgi:phosphatidylglycerophosphate synthase
LGTAEDQHAAVAEAAVRRPIKARNARWASRAAAALARAGVTPNQISIASVGFGALAGGCLSAGAHSQSTALRVALPAAAAACAQLRLTCNLLDGMVAVEYGRKTKSGELFNDLPDRFADAFIFVGAGYAIPSVTHGAALGWAVGLLAVMTAYVRVLGGSMGLAQSFLGPMAKQHRMAVITVACLAQAAESAAGWPARALPAALGVIAAGCVVTIWRRLGRIVTEAEARVAS